MSDVVGRLPVSVLTGFLGSGKTTLLSRLIRDPALHRTACVINEFGEVGLDHWLVAPGGEDIVLLNSGCLCCTIRGDLVKTLTDLFLRRVRGEVPEFDRVVIETTGLADPTPILHTLIADPLIAARFRLDGVIATVDGRHGEDQLDCHPESVKQAAVADRLVVTKSDLAEDASLARLESRLQALNPAAHRIRAVHGAVAPGLLFDAGLYDPKTKSPDVQRWLQAEAYADTPQVHTHDHDHHDHDHQPIDINRHDRQIASFCLSVAEPLPWSSFVDFVETLIASHGASLLRLKGILNLQETEQPVVVHGIQHLFYPPVELSAWPSPDHRSRLVFITRDLSRSVVEALLQRHLAPG